MLITGVTLIAQSLPFRFLVLKQTILRHKRTSSVNLSSVIAVKDLIELLMLVLVPDRVKLLSDAMRRAIL